MGDSTPLDDAALVAAFRAGEESAFATIYDRYSDRLYDFCVSMLRDRDEAADAMQETFVVAADGLGQLREPDRLRSWLYAIARNDCIRRSKRRARTRAGGDQMTDYAASGRGPDEQVQSDEARDLVWAAAAGLAPRDQALLDLHVRQGLEGQELADALELPAPRVYVMLSRLRDQVERSMGALLLARLGRRDCPELAIVLGDWDGRLTPLVRKRVARHADGCPECSERRRTLFSPLALLGAVPVVSAPPHLRDELLGNISSSSSRIRHDAPDSSDLALDQPAGSTRTNHRRRTRRTILLAAGLSLLAAITAFLTLGGLGDGTRDTAVRAVSATDPDTRPPARTSSSTLPVGGPTTSTNRGVPVSTPDAEPGVPNNRSATSETPSPTPTSIPPTGPTSASSTTVPALPPQISQLTGPSTICNNGTSEVQATILSPTPLESADIIWTSTAGVRHIAPMSRQGSSYLAPIGPFGNAAPTGTWQVTATNARGQTTTSPNRIISIEFCPG